MKNQGLVVQCNHKAQLVRRGVDRGFRRTEAYEIVHVHVWLRAGQCCSSTRITHVSTKAKRSSLKVVTASLEYLFDPSNPFDNFVDLVITLLE